MFSFSTAFLNLHFLEFCRVRFLGLGHLHERRPKLVTKKPVFKTIMQQAHHDCQCVMHASPLRAVLVPSQLGYELIANGYFMRCHSWRGPF